ncbi:MAG: VPLPA-CTERM sorting domain-containing protein [Methylococcales bacterium]
MSILKSLTLGLLLNVPIIAMATTMTLNNPVALPEYATYSGDRLIIPDQIEDIDTGVIYLGENLPAFNNEWTLAVGEGELADIVIGSFSNGDFEINDFNVSSDIVSYSGLTGIHTFTITGTPSGTSGGSYFVTTSVSAVPLPATAWLMASALVGLASLGKRKTAIAA